MLRRDFMKSSAILAGTLLTPVSLFADDLKIKIAIVGTGWWGTDFVLANILKSNLYEVVGLCDVNTARLKNAADIIAKSGAQEPKLFSSYKQMYELPGLQAVAIATPTYWHALHFIDACKKGLHVFLEKPICYDIREGQAMLEAHKKAKNVVIVDFPRTMSDTNSKVKTLIQNGEIGKVYQAQANIHNPEGSVVEKGIPASMDYDSFCGPAPKLKYLCGEGGDTPDWRMQYGFSRGIMADWGIHYIHNIRKVLDLDLPDYVTATGGILKNVTSDNPDFLDVRFDFGTLPVYWTHKSWGYTAPNPKHNIGTYYFGEKGTIFAGDLGWEVYSSTGENTGVGDVQFDMGNEANFAKYIQMYQDMMIEFAEGIRKGNNSGISNTFDDGHKTTSCIIYGDMAFRTKSNLAINTATFDITNNKEAQALLKRPYRAPYQHPWGN
jgi:predicted dehydrogenase